MGLFNRRPPSKDLAEEVKSGAVVSQATAAAVRGSVLGRYTPPPSPPSSPVPSRKDSTGSNSSGGYVRLGDPDPVTEHNSPSPSPTQSRT